MDGIIIINKEKGYTSRDVVNIVSKELKIKKVGHTGTLDPMAEGVLVICVGSATKLVDMITSYDKDYVAEVALGIETDTLDSEGTIIKESDFTLIKKDLSDALNSFKGTYLQEVPIYSAVKIDGKKLYEYARENKKIELPKREVNIKEIELVSVDEPNNKFTFRTTVSKGTYIRSLVRDIAYKLNTFGTMTNLIRTRQGDFSINDSITLEEFKNQEYKLLTIKEIFKDIKHIKTSDRLINHANVIDNIYNEDIILFLDENEDPIALYEATLNNKMKPTKVFKNMN
jgi:tRNA pseudouridine55 synthase